MKKGLKKCAAVVLSLFVGAITVIALIVLLAAMEAFLGHGSGVLLFGTIAAASLLYPYIAAFLCGPSGSLWDAKFESASDRQYRDR